MSAADDLITAMHTAGGSTQRLVSEWLDLAQEHAALRDAIRVTHGKRLPTPQAFGLWLSERLGHTAGPLRLQGRHSGNRKAWVYRIVDYVKLAELARQEAERQAQIRAQHEEARRQQAAAMQAAAMQAAEAERARRVHEMHQPPCEEYVYEPTRYASDGTPLPNTMVVDPRNGEPVKRKPLAPEQPAPEPQPATRRGDKRPIWIRENRQPTREEWEAHQAQRMPYQPEGRAASGGSLGPEWFLGSRFPNNGVDTSVGHRWSKNL